jgi:predicted DNA-binding WGR domain protein
MSVFEVTTLHNTQGNSDKLYIVKLKLHDPVNKRWVVHFEYGRRGNQLVQGSKTNNPLPIGAATTVYNKLINSKRDKGYRDIPELNNTKSEKKEHLKQLLVTMMQHDLFTVEEYKKIFGLTQSTDEECVRLAEKLITVKAEQ